MNLRNQCNFIGRLTADPVIEKVGANQTSKCEFTLAVNRGFKNKEGKYDADFIRMTAWNQSADYLGKYACKGTELHVFGEIRTDSFKGQDGNMVYTTKVVVESLTIQSAGKNANTVEIASANVETTPTEDDFTASVADVDISANDLPF